MIAVTLKCLTIVGLFLLLPGCNRQKGDAEDSSGNVRVHVRISRLASGDIESTVTGAGSTDVLRREKVLSPVAGRVLSLKVLEGSPVRAGEVMVILRTREAQATIEGARALMRSATTERQREEARRALALADSLQPQISLRAGFNGVIASRNVTEGELVSDQTELLTLIDLSSVVFIADVPINSGSSVRVGLPARVRFPQLAATEFPAVVDAVSPQAEALSQSVKVRLRFGALRPDQRRLLKANIPGTAWIVTGVHRNTLIVRRSALLHNDESDAYSVVIMTEDSVARVVPVTIGVQADSLVEVRGEALRAGQNVIIQGQYALTDSTRVTVEQP